MPMKRYLILIPIVAILVLTSGLVQICRQETRSRVSETPASQLSASEVLEFARAIWLVEQE